MEELGFRDLTFFYPGSDTPALHHITLSVERGAFFVLCGASGSGKTTLLRQCKPSLTPNGHRTGEILFRGEPLSADDPVGFVMQDPEKQIVTDRVCSELAFAPENTGTDPALIRKRSAEIASLFGIESLYRQKTDLLSGGQKQILSIASAMTAQPDVLILDEPTARLDPIAADQLLSMLVRLNRELGTTVILSEHRLEAVLPLASQCAFMENGAVLASGTPEDVCGFLKNNRHPFYRAMPTSVRVWGSLQTDSPCPLTANEAKRFVTDYLQTHVPDAFAYEQKPLSGKTVLSVSDVWYRYERDARDILTGLSFSAQAGELLCILGGNGAGKTTALKLFAGIIKPCRGSIEKTGIFAYLPQNPEALFLKNTLREDYLAFLSERRDTEPEVKLKNVSELCGITELLDRHPFDLSGGELQCAALAKLLLHEPDLLLLDEPTKGLDAIAKSGFARILMHLKERGVCIVTVSHDVEFCAEYADRCGLLFDGALLGTKDPHVFFSGNGSYTTSANRIARDFAPEVITTGELISVLGGTEEITQESDPHSLRDYPCREENLVISAEDTPPGTKKKRSFLSVLAIAVSVLLIPATILSFFFLKAQNRYALTCVLVLLECMLPFFFSFEGRKPSARELALLASFCALGIAGRAAFFMLPQFKPVLALTIISGVTLGGEAGFLVGAITMLVSDLLFSIGPWTPFQMFAAGLIGLLAGILHRKGVLRSKKLPLCIFGAICTIVIYGGITNPSTALFWASESLNLKLLLAYYVSGFPMDAIHALATALFLWFGAEPLIQKTERVKTKFGLLTST